MLLFFSIRNLQSEIPNRNADYWILTTVAGKLNNHESSAKSRKYH